MKEHIYELVRHPAGRLRQTLSGGTRVLIFFIEPFSGNVEICWPLNNLPEISKPTATLVQNCLKRQRSILVHDAKVDPLIGSVPGADFSSALCVPLFDQVENPMGVLYADTQAPGELDKNKRLDFEKFARTLAPRIPKWTVADIGPQEEEGKAAPPDYRGPLALLGILAIFCFLWLSALDTSPPKDVPVASQVEEKTPRDTVKTYLGLLHLRQLEHAWDLLTPSLQSRMPSAQFTELNQDWFSQNSNKEDFQRRQLRAGPITGDSAVVYLEPGPDVRADTWTYELILSDGEWLINGVTGGGPVNLANSDPSP